MFIIGLGTAAPSQRYAQRESWEALRNWPRFSELKPRSHAILKKVLCGDNGIDTRHLALEPLAEVFNQTPDALQARFEQHAPALATEAARRALQEAGCAPEEMDAILISTCTGYLCPGLTSYVSEQLGLRSNIFALDLVGQGVRRSTAKPAEQRGDPGRRARKKNPVHLRRGLQRGLLH